MGESAKPAARALIVGVDGGTLQLVEPWVAAGYLPNWRRLMEEGAWGVLQSTYPGLTAPAWMSFKTGKHPGKTGIYDFFYRDPATMRHRVVSALVCAEPTLAEVLNAQGKRVGMLFEPTSFPARPLDGFMVCGFLTPDHGTEGYTYPKDLLERNGVDDPASLEKVLPRGFFRGGRLGELPDAIIRNIESQGETARRLMRGEPWEVFFVHFFGSDTICHAMWRYMDVANPKSGAQYADAVLRVYQAIDRQIGLLMAELGDNGLTVVMSDHGFGPGKEQININTWLLERGLLAVKPTDLQTAVRRLRQVRDTAGGWRRQPKRRYALKVLEVCLPLYAILPDIGRRAVDRILNRVLDRRPRAKSLATEPTFYFDQIDWPRTRAYAIGARGGVFINLKGREAYGTVSQEEYEGLRQEIIEGLNAIAAPGGEPAIKNACRREEAYSGPYLDRAPDIIAVTEELGFLVRSTFGDRVVEPNPTTRSGLHRSDGMLFLHGGPVGADTHIEGASIVDVLPTLLFLLGLGVPDDLDGKPLVGVATAGYAAEHPVQYVAPLAARGDGGGSSQTDDDALIDALAGLGYL
jgi:predicted AlkP superfamily phosphohydrolase/phosphomutase